MSENKKPEEAKEKSALAGKPAVADFDSEVSDESLDVAVDEVEATSSAEEWAEALGGERDSETDVDQASGIRKKLEQHHSYEPTVKPVTAALDSFDEEPVGANPIIGDPSMVMNIPVTFSVEVGRTKLSVKQILQLAQGSVVELDKMAGEPLSILVNGTPFAKGEIVVVNDKFAIRLTDVLDPKMRGM